MCLLTYIHYHHQPPCTRPASVSVHYSYCAAAPLDPFTNSPSTPCLATMLDPTSPSSPPDSHDGLGNPNPCMSGNCLISPACSSGACRLQDLNGRWTCCKCRRGGNVYRWCHHRKRGCPDTFCYHELCQRCTADRG